MTGFQFYQPLEVRYSDLDPQGHVNNAVYLTYMEQGRIGYIHHLGLWEGGSWMEIGIILADAQVTYKTPILYGTPVRVGVRVAHLGNKSLKMEYCLVDEQERELATGATVLVSYDYKNGKAVPVPEHWRIVITEYEKIGSK